MFNFTEEVPRKIIYGHQKEGVFGTKHFHWVISCVHFPTFIMFQYIRETTTKAGNGINQYSGLKICCLG